MSRQKRRSCLFDIVADEPVDAPVVSRDFFSVIPPQAETQSSTPVPPPAVDEECESMESANSNDNDAILPNPEVLQYPFPIVYPAYVAPLYPLFISIWPGYNLEPVKEDTHEVVKPTAVHSKTPMKVDELVGVSKLSLGESLADSGQSTLSLKLVEGSSRPSAFHAKPASDGSGMTSSHNPIHAV